MDLASTGSTISKYNIDNAFIKREKESYLKKVVNSEEQKNEIKEEIPKVKELTLDDFLDDFKI